MLAHGQLTPKDAVALPLREVRPSFPVLPNRATALTGVFLLHHLSNVSTSDDGLEAQPRKRPAG